MNKYIGIIAAETEEVIEIKKIMKNLQQVHIYECTIYNGEIGNKRYLLAKSGIGKVNAARITQILTDKFDIEYIINIGSAGGLNDNLNIGDIVVGAELIQHDFNLTAFGHERGYVPEIGKIFRSDRELIERSKKINLKDSKIIIGTIVSGDVFCNTIISKEKIRKTFNAECVEMEGAAIAQVCYLNNMPFIVIRSISDIPNGKNQIDFKEYLKIASKNCADFILKMSL